MDDLAPIIWAVYVYAIEHGMEIGDVLHLIEERCEDVIREFEIAMMVEAQV